MSEIGLSDEALTWEEAVSSAAKSLDTLYQADNGLLVESLRRLVVSKPLLNEPIWVGSWLGEVFPDPTRKNLRFAVTATGDDPSQWHATGVDASTKLRFAVSGSGDFRS
ncbi:hypothetical protein ACEZCY_04000 [Streptacidiphilus sp. N1-12]|uniref:Uncharacterized protein n=2 Tax=Streptacidiphilus alkalitolerans TaxID=3342712 RepID=A0ABV6W8L8_9ACTN